LVTSMPTAIIFLLEALQVETVTAEIMTQQSKRNLQARHGSVRFVQIYAHKTNDSMNNPGATGTLVILFFRAPRILEGTERSQNGVNNLDGIFAFRSGSNYSGGLRLRLSSRFP
jgi:hypothetical protein